MEYVRVILDLQDRRIVVRRRRKAPVTALPIEQNRLGQDVSATVFLCCPVDLTVEATSPGTHYGALINDENKADRPSLEGTIRSQSHCFIYL